MKDRSDTFERCFCMAIYAALIVAIILLTSACSVCRRQPQVVWRDSIRVEYRDRVVHDTAYVQIPVEVEKIVTRDTTSYLTNGFGESEAVVSGGYLSHTLRTKPQVLKVPVEVTVHDTIFVQKAAEIRTETVEVEKPLTWWRRFRIRAFWWLVAIALVGWRREIGAAFKWLLKMI